MGNIGSCIREGDEVLFDSFSHFSLHGKAMIDAVGRADHRKEWWLISADLDFLIDHDMDDNAIRRAFEAIDVIAVSQIHQIQMKLS